MSDRCRGMPRLRDACHEASVCDRPVCMIHDSSNNLRRSSRERSSSSSMGSYRRHRKSSHSRRVRSRSRSRSFSASRSRSGRPRTEHGNGPPDSFVEDTIAQQVAKEIKRRVDEEVSKYVASSTFASMVEAMKRRERERIVSEISELIRLEREEMLFTEKDKLRKEIADSLAYKEILAENQRKIEEQQRNDLLDKQNAETLRLQDVHMKQKEDMVLQLEAINAEKDRAITLMEARKTEQQLILGRAEKISFGIKKKTCLF